MKDEGEDHARLTMYNFVAPNGMHHSRFSNLLNEPRQQYTETNTCHVTGTKVVMSSHKLSCPRTAYSML